MRLFKKIKFFFVASLFGVAFLSCSLAQAQSVQAIKSKLEAQQSEAKNNVAAISLAIEKAEKKLKDNSGPVVNSQDLDYLKGQLATAQGELSRIDQHVNSLKSVGDGKMTAQSAAAIQQARTFSESYRPTYQMSEVQQAEARIDELSIAKEAPTQSVQSQTAQNTGSVEQTQTVQQVQFNVTQPPVPEEPANEVVMMETSLSKRDSEDIRGVDQDTIDKAQEIAKQSEEDKKNAKSAADAAKKFAEENPDNQEAQSKSKEYADIASEAAKKSEQASQNAKDVVSLTSKDTDKINSIKKFSEDYKTSYVAFTAPIVVKTEIVSTSSRDEKDDKASSDDTTDKVIARAKEVEALAKEDKEKTEAAAEAAKKFAEANPNDTEAQAIAKEYQDRSRLAVNKLAEATKSYKRALTTKEAQDKYDELLIKKRMIEAEVAESSAKAANALEKAKNDVASAVKIDKVKKELRAAEIKKVQASAGIKNAQIFNESYKTTFVEFKAPETKVGLQVAIVEGEAESGSTDTTGGGTGGPVILQGGDSKQNDPTNVNLGNTFNANSGVSGTGTGGGTTGTTNTFTPPTRPVFDPVADKPKVKVILSSKKQ